jgi:hypothetical protein
MEDVLEVYHRPYNEKRPLVALDEASKQRDRTAAAARTRTAAAV